MEILDDRKTLAIQLLAKGEDTKTNIAKKCGVARQTLYDWMNDDKFRSELDRRLQQRKVLVEKVIDSKLEGAVDQLFTLAETTTNSRVKAQTLQYIIDRGLGKATSKVELSTEINTTNVNDDILEVEYDELLQEPSE